MPSPKNVPAAVPAATNYAMPAEWEAHEATWLGWPHNTGDWPGKFEVIPWIYGEMIRKISAGEKIRLLVRHDADGNFARHVLKHGGWTCGKSGLCTHPTNRGWTRDTGPIFVRPPQARRETREPPNRTRRLCIFISMAGPNMTTGGRTPRCRKPRPACCAKQLYSRRMQGPAFVIEGGGIEVNGRGTLLSTEECYLHPKSRCAIRGWAGGKSRRRCGNIWARRTFSGWPKARRAMTRTGTLTTSAGSSTPGRWCWSGSTIRATRITGRWRKTGSASADLRLEDGGQPEVVALPMPAPLYFDGVRLPASYANFYICNAAVIVPTFNDPNDRVALGILGECFRDRPVVGIHAVDLVWGFGSLHCLTQQQPV